MKHTFISIRSLAFTFLLGACSSDFNELPMHDNPPDVLTILVNMDGFSDEHLVSTRAIDDGARTFFQDGDCVGIIAIKDGSATSQQSVTYDATSRSWKAGDSDTYDDTGATTYVPYFPYKKDLSLTNINNESSALTAIKAAIKPQEDQRTITAYRASDLLTGNCTYSGSTLSINLSHAYSLLWLQAGTEYSTLDDYVYRTPVIDVVVNNNERLLYPNASVDGYRLVMDAGISSQSDIDMKWFYTLASGRSYQITTNTLPGSGKYRLYRNVTNGGIRPIKVGDYYYDGGIFPCDTENPPSEGCIGIVFEVGSEVFNEDPLLKRDHPDCTHGLVVALQEAGNMHWSNSFENITTQWLNKDGNPYKGVVNLQEENKRCGYSNTLALMDYNAKKYSSIVSSNDSYRVLPYDGIQQYAVVHPAPANSSGWYFPSKRELIVLFNNQPFLNGQLGKLGDGNYEQIENGDYWSSTDKSDDYAWAVFRGRSNAGTQGQEKSSRNNYVRPFLAF